MSEARKRRHRRGYRRARGFACLMPVAMRLLDGACGLQDLFVEQNGAPRTQGRSLAFSRDGSRMRAVNSQIAGFPQDCLDPVEGGDAGKGASHPVCPHSASR